ncbi:MAG TPA: hypothetical protein VNZ53_43480 [Steroidobacteraceae bacterium]|nr:hypothetical protein [Steroidobacteraceae bacterium]
MGANLTYYIREGLLVGSSMDECFTCPRTPEVVAGARRMRV